MNQNNSAECREDSKPTITFGPSAAETVIEEFGWEVDEEGYITSESDVRVAATDGEEIQVEDLGGIVEDDSGNPVPLRDDFLSIVNHVIDRKQENE